MCVNRSFTLTRQELIPKAAHSQIPPDGAHVHPCASTSCSPLSPRPCPDLSAALTRAALLG